MFANAYEIASEFTHPLIVSTRFFDGTVECGLGTFVIINPEGWVITVVHMLSALPTHEQHAKEINEYKTQIASIEQNISLNAKQKQRKFGQVKTNPKWMTNYSFWWGWDGVQAKDIFVFPEADLAIARLEPFHSSRIKKYPVFKSPANLRCGTSLCKLGYPFHNIEANYNETTDSFELAPGALPVPRFPIDGIYTRNVITGRSNDGKHDIKFLETSTPGLRGQSGGPIFDTNGTIWAIQSRTTHFPLGFSPIINKGGREIEEHQFLNVGWGIHPEIIVEFLAEKNIDFQLSDY